MLLSKGRASKVGPGESRVLVDKDVVGCVDWKRGCSVADQPQK
jgi:hypothetical protein